LTRFDVRAGDDPAAIAPAAVVLDDCDGDFQEARPHRDGLRFLGGTGEPRVHLKQFNLSQSISMNRCVAVDAGRGRVYVAETDSEHLIALDSRGRRLWQARAIRASAVAVDLRSGNLWCGIGRDLSQGETVVLDPDGNLVDSLPYRAYDIAYDPHSEAFWLVGQGIAKVNRAGDLLFRKPLHGWTYVSVAVDPGDGSARIAERSHPNAPGSVNRLLHFNAKGEEVWSTMMGDAIPWTVACDPKTGTAWLAIAGAGIRRFARDGQELAPIPLGVVGLDISRTTGRVWVATQMEIFQFDATGALLTTTPLGEFSGQSRVAAF
jgi:outer membrane protein assembly factor BamB